MTAATNWFPYDPADPLVPHPGEWCLWSMITPRGGQRIYFAGGIFVDNGGTRWITWQGRERQEKPNNSLYWARVIRPTICLIHDKPLLADSPFCEDCRADEIWMVK